MHQRPSREESHRGRVLSRAQAQRDHNREDRRDRVRAHLDRGQSQGRDPLGRDPGKDHQDKAPNQAKVLLGKAPQARAPGKVRVLRAPNRAKVLLAKVPQDPGKVRVLLVKDPQDNRVLNQVRVPQVQVSNREALLHKRVDPHHKDLESRGLNSKAHLAPGLSLGGQLRVEDLLLVSRSQERQEVDSVHCVRPPN